MFFQKGEPFNSMAMAFLVAQSIANASSFMKFSLRFFLVPSIGSFTGRMELN